MSIDVVQQQGRESKYFSFDRYQIRTSLGELGLRVYGPSQRLIDQREEEPDTAVAYGPGFAQGVDAINDIGERLAKDGHMRFAALELPIETLDLAEAVPYRTDALMSASEVLSTYYPDQRQVVMGYSWGSFPAANVSRERASFIRGAGFISPTWWSAKHSPASLALRGGLECLGALVGDSPRDRLDLMKMGFHAFKEARRRPLGLRRDVTTIATDPRPAGIVDDLKDVPHVGVVIGEHDGLCRGSEITVVASQIYDSNPERGVDIRRVRSDHFHVFTNKASRQTIIDLTKELAK